MALVVLTVVVIALLIAALAIFLFRIGMLLNRTAGDLEDCAQSVKRYPTRPSRSDLVSCASTKPVPQF